jgi:hypothetical protein
LQVAEQPSPLATLPSSHSSGRRWTPSPHCPSPPPPSPPPSTPPADELCELTDEDPGVAQSWLCVQIPPVQQEGETMVNVPVLSQQPISVQEDPTDLQEANAC